MGEMTKSQLEKHNEWLISKSNQYADNINALYRDGIEYFYYPEIPDNKRIAWFDKKYKEKIE
jgi:hypothetical protein